MSETLEGVIERITFHNMDSGFAVLRVQPRGRRDLVTVVGTIPSVVAGEFIEAAGEWVQTRDHGHQFKAESLRTSPPGSVEGIRRYLGSGLVKGIGPHFARKIVDAFGDKTLHVIDESPQFLSEVKGIGPKRIQQIRQSWQEQKAVRGIMIFLQSFGIGTARAVRIYKTYGDQAIEVVRENPYRLATDIWGVGFQTADELALRMGTDRNSPLRAQAAIRYVLQDFSEKGHVGYPEEGVIAAAMAATQIGRDVVVEAVEQVRAQGDVVRDSPGLIAKSTQSPDDEPEMFSGRLQAPVKGAMPTALRGHADLPCPRKAVGMAPDTSGAGDSRVPLNEIVAPSDETWLFLKPLFLAELGVARQIHALKDGPHPMPNCNVVAA